MAYFLIIVNNFEEVTYNNNKIPIGTLTKVVKASSKESVEKLIKDMIAELGLKKYDYRIEEISEAEVSLFWGDLPILEVD